MMTFARFKQIVYAVARLAGARVLALQEPQVTPNFYAAKLALNHTELFLVCNFEGVWACAADYQPDHWRLKFADSETLAEALKAGFGIRLLTLNELESEFRKQPGQSDADIAYWKPASLGAGHFNWWD